MLMTYRNFPVQEFIQIISTSGSVAVVLVWACICLAYIRYKAWLNICKSGIRTDELEYDRNSPRYPAKTLLFSLQPAMAWIGLIGSLLVLAFASASWWDHPATFGKVSVQHLFAPFRQFAYGFRGVPWPTQPSS